MYGGWDSGPIGGRLRDGLGVHEAEAKSGVDAQAGGVLLPAQVVSERRHLCRPHHQVLHVPPRQRRARG